MGFRSRKIVAVFILLFFLFSPSISLSMGADTFGLTPAYPDPNVFGSDIRFMYNLDLGQSKIDGFRLINNREETVIIKVYPVDATTTSDGAYSLLLEEDPRQDIGKWIHIATNEVEVGPVTEKTVPFKINIPSNADTGDHFGGIVIEEVNMLNQLQGTGIKVLSRIGTRVYETIPGEVRKKFEVTRFDYTYAGTGTSSPIKDFLDINKRTIFFAGVKNEGNVKITPRVTVDITNIFGMKTAHLENREAGIVLPRGENRDTSTIWNGIPLLGRYKVKMTVNAADSGLEDQTREIAIWAFPYKIFFILIILAILLVLLRLIKAYFSEAAKEKFPIYQVRLGDNLAVLGEKFNISWKLIAKVNYIGKPYDIKEGDKLFIPIKRGNREIIKQMKLKGEIMPSLIERSGRSSLKHKRIIALIIILLAIGGGVLWVIKSREEKKGIEPAPTAPQELPKETMEKTASGAYKKSSVKVKIITGATGEWESSQRLFKKLELTGYNVNLSPDNSGKYQGTIVEYVSGKKDQAEMVKNDLEAKGQAVEIKEISDPIEEDVIVYNTLDKNLYLKVEEYKNLITGE